MILIIAPHSDDHALPVAAELRRRGAAVEIVDMADLPRRSSASVRFEPEATMSATVGSLDLSTVETIWLRRISAPDPPPLADRWWAVAEWHHLLVGLGQVLRGRRWINPLETFYLDGGFGKVRQLEAARSVGLEVPRTLVTSVPDEARAFVASCPGGAIYKPLASRQGRDRAGKLTAIFTTEVTTAWDFAAVAHAPCVFQERVAKAFELRVTIMGQRVFATEIHSQTHADSAVDYRRRYLDVPHAAHSLPPEIEARLLRLHRNLGIVFSTGDMIVTPDGRYVWLELNWQGQWLWSTVKTREPLLEAFCDLLTGVAAPSPIRCG